MSSFQPQRNDVLLRGAANPKILDEWSAARKLPCWLFPDAPSLGWNCGVEGILIK
jgi:hypothetical protein